jgi:hypothetical protein
MENYIKNFGAWTNVNEEAETSQFSSKVESLMADHDKTGSILKCIEGKPKLKELSAISLKALMYSLLMGAAGYAVVQTGGLATGMLTAVSGYMSGTELEKLKSLDWKAIDREIKSCERCLKSSIG